MSELRAYAVDTLADVGHDEPELAALLGLGRRQTAFTAGKTWAELLAWRNDLVARYGRAEWEYHLACSLAGDDTADALEVALERLWSIEQEAEAAGFPIEDLAAWQDYDENGEEVPF